MEKARNRKTGEIVEYDTVYEKKYYPYSYATAETPHPYYNERWILFNGVKIHPNNFFHDFEYISER